MSKIIQPVQPTLTDMDVYIKEIASVWQTGMMTNNGEKVNRFQDMLRQYIGCKNVDLFVNGHSALSIALQTLELKGEVITSPFTFVSTTHAIIQNGLTPVFADIDNTYNIDPNGIEEMITPNTCAIVVPHIFGIPCDVKRIDEIAQKYNLKVIYDAAQAFGTKVEGKNIGCYGDVTMFSFHATKIFNAIEGGMLSYNDDALHKSFEWYRNFGISYGDTNEVEVIGYNAKMNEFQAAMGIVNLPILDAEIEKRKLIANWYCELLKDIPGVYTYQYEAGIDYNYAYFPVKIIEAEYGISRNELWKRLKEKGIITRKLYDRLTCDYKCYQGMNFVRKTDNAQRIADIALDLPLYGKLSKEDVEFIGHAIKNAL